jgi:hypothetical protein
MVNTEAGFAGLFSFYAHLDATEFMLPLPQ